MNRTVRSLLAHEEDNHVLPFFWQHGEDENTLRHMMRVIRGASCRAVCVESRPHPDFCGPRWWHDMDIILEEARALSMRVWILDDSHFPTGYANNALHDRPDALCRQGLFMNTLPLPAQAGTYTLDLRAEGLMDAPKRTPANAAEARWFAQKPARMFSDDRVLCASFVQDGQTTDVTDALCGERLTLEKPAGEAELRVTVVSRNAGYHRNYINMTEKDSVQVLIDTVYEAHWQHYASEFGKTIAGFFSDEPELGNGFMYAKGNVLGTRQDLPWGATLEKEVAAALGTGWKQDMEKLWCDDPSPRTAAVRFAYMDCLTRLVQENFSENIGRWCRAHHVMYIGHVIEDDGQHCRTGSSLGHYFRGLSGQDMAGIDDIGGQVLPQGEDAPVRNFMSQPRDGTFYHYGLAKLAQSAAALEPRKKGRAMCEIFGNYGWAEGVRLEKYLADHFLVRGITDFVPHAFTGKAFPDPDCPPHFYAQGHHPQYRAFGQLMTYINRVSTLTSSGRHQTCAAILYHGEAEWCDAAAMPFEKPLRALYDAQMDSHTVPADLLGDSTHVVCFPDHSFQICGQRYHLMLVPASRSLCRTAIAGLKLLASHGVPVWFVAPAPQSISETGEALPGILQQCPVIPLEQLAEKARRLTGTACACIKPANPRIRVLEIAGDTPLAMLVNEGTAPWHGTFRSAMTDGPCFLYDAWQNICLPAEKTAEGVVLTVCPLHAVFLVSGPCTALQHIPEAGQPVPLAHWTRALCEASRYPDFDAPEDTCLPDGDRVAQAYPAFSGYVRYETGFTLEKDAELVLTIQDASEAVEVFLNGASAGIQIAPPFRYILHGRAGANLLRLEVATTLERECYPLLEGYRKLLAEVPSCPSGITGTVTLALVQ